MATISSKLLRLHFLVLLCISSVTATAQLVHTETLETEGLGTRYQANFFTVADACGSTDFFKRTQRATCTGNLNENFAQGRASNIQGAYFAAGSDVCKADDANENPLGAGENAYFIVKTLDVSSFGSVDIQLALAGDQGQTDMQVTDGVIIGVAFDGNIATGANLVNGLPTASNVNKGTYTTIGAFYGDGLLFPNPSYFRQDADLNGRADPAGLRLLNAFQDFTFTTSVPSGATKMSVRIMIKTCRGGEGVAFDNIRITGLSTAPLATISATPATLAENVSGDFTYTVQLSKPAVTNTTVSFNVGGTATFSADYSVSGATSFTSSAGSVVINAGTISKSFTLRPVNDAQLEPSESITLTLSGGGSAYNIGTPNAATVNILNDDSDGVAPKIAITGLNHNLPNGFSFVALENFTSSRTYYFTENEFDNITLSFSDQTESVVKWVSPATVTKGQVFVVSETSPNTFSITCSNAATCGSISKTAASGDFAMAQTGEAFTAYSDTNDDPTDLVGQVHSTLFTGNATGSSGGNIPAIENPITVYTNAVLVQGFPATSANRTEFKPLLRNTTVDVANFQNTANWDHAAANQLLSTVPFTNITIAEEASIPSVNIAVSPASVTEGSGTALVYTFTLSQTASTNYTVNFNYSGTAVAGTDFTHSFLPAAGSVLNTNGTGSIRIAAGTKSSSLSITPINDQTLETDKSLKITITSGTGYKPGGNNAASGVLENDDSDATEPAVAIVGARHESNHGLSVVALRNLVAGEIFYFTNNEYDKSTLAFDNNNEFVVQWTIPTGGFLQGNVMRFEETTTTSNTFGVSCSNPPTCGSVSLVSPGNFTISAGGEGFYAYTDTNTNPTDGIITVNAILFTGNQGTTGGSIPAKENAKLVYPKAVLVDGFTAGGFAAGRMEYDPTKRNVTVERVNLINTANWIFKGTNQSLSTTPFTNIAVLSPEIKVTDNAGNELFSGTTTTSTTNSTNFGTSCTSGGNERAFKILNPLIGNLTLTGTPKVVITGPNASFFTVVTQPNSPITNGNSTTFVIRHAASTSGTHTATVSIASNDSDENPFTFAISGDKKDVAQTVGYDSDISTSVPVVQAISYVFASNKILQPNGRAMYQAGSAVVLNPGFEVQQGAVFEAKIKNPCQ